MSIATLSKKLAISLQALVMLLGVGSAGVAGAVVLAAPAYAECGAFDAGSTTSGGAISGGANCSQGNSQKSNLFGTAGIFTIAANTLIFIIGAVSVIYLIIGGLRYTTSGGDSKAVTTAKDTILYAIVGIVVAIVSFAVVNFVISALNAAN